MIKVLIITNTTDFTSDYVVRSLDSIHAQYYRLNTDEIGNQVFLSFDFVHDKFSLFDKPKNLELDIRSFKAVYFRRPEVPTFDGIGLTSAERQFMSLEVRQTLEGLYKVLRDAFWINDIDSIRKAENKVFQQLVAKEIGLRIPAGIITNQPEQFRSFVNNNEDDCIVKPIFSGRVGWPEMQQVVFTSELDSLPSVQQIEVCPTFIQKRLKKKFDVRVTVVGGDIFAVRIHSQSNPETQTDWRVGEKLLKHEVIVLSDSLSKQCHELLHRFNLVFGAIDFVETEDNEFIFLEINPNGQWGWIQAQTGMPISDTIVKLLINEQYS